MGFWALWLAVCREKEWHFTRAHSCTEERGSLDSARAWGARWPCFACGWPWVPFPWMERTFWMARKPKLINLNDIFMTDQHHWICPKEDSWTFLRSSKVHCGIGRGLFGSCGCPQLANSSCEHSFSLTFLLSLQLLLPSLLPPPWRGLLLCFVKSTHWTLPSPLKVMVSASRAFNGCDLWPSLASSPVSSLHVNFPKNKSMRSSNKASGAPSCWSVQILPIFRI